MSNEGDNDGWSEPRTTDYCVTCGDSPESGRHTPGFGDYHPYAPRRNGSGPTQSAECKWHGCSTRVSPPSASGRCSAHRGLMCDHASGGHVGKCLPRKTPEWPSPTAAQVEETVSFWESRMNTLRRKADLDMWDAATGFTRTPPSAAHLGKGRLVDKVHDEEIWEFDNKQDMLDALRSSMVRGSASTRAFRITREALAHGVNLSTDQNLLDGAKMVEEVLALDDANRKAHPEDYPATDSAPFREELMREREKTEHLTARITKLNREAVEAHGRARHSEEKLDLSKDHIAKLQNEIQRGDERLATMRKVADAACKERDAVQEQANLIAEQRNDWIQAHNNVEGEVIDLTAKLVDAQRAAKRPVRVLQVYSWVLLLALLSVLALTLAGCAPETGPCGEPIPNEKVTCGCDKTACVTPCTTCCDVVPCPVEGCAH